MTPPLASRSRTATEGQRLAADAAAAAEVRTWQTHPDVVALKVERVRLFGERLIWSSIGILLIFTMFSVQIFVAGDAETGSREWVAAWFLEPGIVAGLVGLLVWEGVTTHWGVFTGPWVRSAKWGLLAATYGMNTANSWAAGDWRGILAHSVPPIAVFFLTEARTEMLLKLEETVVKAHAFTEKRNAERARAEAERKAKEAAEAEAERSRVSAELAAQTVPDTLPGPVQTPIAPPAGPVYRAVPSSYAERSEQVHRTVPRATPDRSADRPAPRTKPARTPPPDRFGKPSQTGSDQAKQTDAELVQAARELTGPAGERPTQYLLKQRFGIGSARAARVLAALDGLTPVGAASGNGSHKTDNGSAR